MHVLYMYQMIEHLFIHKFIWEVNSLLSPSHSHSQYRYRVAQQNKVRNLKQDTCNLGHIQT